LLLMVMDPVAAPAVVGSKVMVRVAVCPGLSVRGRLMPESAKPVPVTEMLLRARDAVPVEVSVTVLVVGVLRAEVPKAALELLRVRAGVVAFRVRAQAFEMLPAEAVKVAVCAAETAAAVAVKVALDAPAGMVTEAGKATALVLLARVTVVAAVAAPLRETVQASVPAPVRVALVQETALRAGAAA